MHGAHPVNNIQCVHPVFIYQVIQVKLLLRDPSSFLALALPDNLVGCRLSSNLSPRVLSAYLRYL